MTKLQEILDLLPYLNASELEELIEYARDMASERDLEDYLEEWGDLLE